MSFFTRCGNFSAPSPSEVNQDCGKFEVVRLFEDDGAGAGMNFKDVDGILIVFTKASLSVVSEIFEWRNAGKFMIYTCVNELTRILAYEAFKFIKDNYTAV